MTYDLKRALGISLALYITTFIIGIIAGIISGQDMTSMETISDSFWYVGMISSTIISILFTLWYFQKPQLKNSALGGLFFGITASVVSFALDFLTFSFGNANGAEVDLGAYYGDIRFWIILTLVLVSTTLVGWKKSRITQ